MSPMFGRILDASTYGDPVCWLHSKVMCAFGKYRLMAHKAGRATTVSPINQNPTRSAFHRP